MLMILSYMYHDDCALLIILRLFYTLCIRVVVLYVVLMDWCHVIKAQGGCITYEHDDDDDTYPRYGFKLPPLS